MFLRKLNKKGFTLMELLAVIVLLGVIASISIVVYINATNNYENKISVTNKNNILSSAIDYANEFLSNSKIWVFDKKINKEKYCITINDLIEKGFFKENITEKIKENTIVLQKDSNDVIISNFSENNDECKSQLPEISIDIESESIGDNTYDEMVKFKINLSDVGEYTELYYIVNDNKISCDKNTRTCLGQIKDNYGDITIKAIVTNGSNDNEVTKQIKINLKEPEFEFTTKGTEGNDNWYTSNVTVNTKVKNISDGTQIQICKSKSSESNCSNDSSITLTENDNGYKVCAKVKKAGKEYTECTTEYKIDTSLPTVTISGNYNESTGKIDIYGNFEQDTSGISYISLRSSTATKDYCLEGNESYFSSYDANSNSPIASATSGDKSIWLKDNAGNCSKVISYYTNVSKTGFTSTKTTRPLTVITFPNYKIKKLIFAHGIDSTADVNVLTNEELRAEEDEGQNFVAGIKFSYNNPVKESCTTETETCSKTAKYRSADYDKVCTSRSCPNGGKVSGTKCVANKGSTYKGYTQYTGKFYCTCQNSKCLWSYKTTPTYTRYNLDSSGNCASGYNRYDISNDNPSKTSCTTSENKSYSTTPKTIKYKYNVECRWSGNYTATCTNYDTDYYCDSDEYLSGSKCYYCTGSGETISGKTCEYQCAGVETCKYRYGKYAFLYIIDEEV